jgi:hypothetical protein
MSVLGIETTMSVPPGPMLHLPPSPLQPSEPDQFPFWVNAKYGVWRQCPTVGPAGAQ